MLRSVDFHGLRAVEFSKGDYTALVIPEIGANLVRLCHTGAGRGDSAHACGRRDRDLPAPSAGFRNAAALPAQPYRRRTLRVRRADVPLPHHDREGAQLPPRHPQKPAVRRVEGMGDRRGDARGMPLLLERRERRRIPRLPARVQVQADLPPHAPRHGGRGDVRQPQPAADARRRGFSYADAGSPSPEARRRIT